MSEKKKNYVPITKTDKKKDKYREDIKSKDIKEEKSFLEKFLGSGTNAIICIIGIVVFIMTVNMCIYMQRFQVQPSETYMSALMGILGYLFGKNIHK